MSNIGNKTVCFAEVPEKMRAYKENLMNELEQYGWEIKEVPKAKQQIEKAPEIIEGCEIFIHILSNEDHLIDSNKRSFEEQQIKDSVQYLKSKRLLTESTGKDVNIFVWHPRSSTESIYEEKITPEYLQRIQQIDEIELLRTDYEGFKYYLISHMEALAEVEEDEFQDEGNCDLSVYFQYDKADEEMAIKFIEYLKKKKVTVYTPEFDGDIVEIRKLNNSYLMIMDVAIIFSKTTSVNWVNMKMMDILKSTGLGKENKILGKVVITTDIIEKELILKQRGFDFFSLDQGSAKSKIFSFLKTKQL